MQNTLKEVETLNTVSDLTGDSALQELSELDLKSVNGGRYGGEYYFEEYYKYEYYRYEYYSGNNGGRKGRHGRQDNKQGRCGRQQSPRKSHQCD
jgi:hypothetical protein